MYVRHINKFLIVLRNKLQKTWRAVYCSIKNMQDVIKRKVLNFKQDFPGIGDPNSEKLLKSQEFLQIGDFRCSI
jgi:hypothetical protein